jgi:hypothetical protein
MLTEFGGCFLCTTQGNQRKGSGLRKDGSMDTVEIIQSADEYLSKEAVRCITRIPGWKPRCRRLLFPQSRMRSLYAKIPIHYAGKISLLWSKVNPYE